MSSEVTEKKEHYSKGCNKIQYSNLMLFYFQKIYFQLLFLKAKRNWKDKDKSSPGLCRIYYGYYIFLNI